LELPNPADPKKKIPNGDRIKVLERINQSKEATNRSPEDTVALATLLIRVGRLDEAEGLLARDRQGFLANTTLAHIYALKGDWERAFEYQSIANGDPPAEINRLTPAQVRWQTRLNRGPLTRLFRLRSREAATKARPQNEDVDDL